MTADQEASTVRGRQATFVGILELNGDESSTLVDNLKPLWKIVSKDITSYD